MAGSNTMISPSTSATSNPKSRLGIRVLRVALILAAIATAGGLLVGYVISTNRPPMPPEWNQLQSGMPREEVHRIVKDEVIDMRELKGFESASREARMFDYSAYWHLLLRYDNSNRLEAAEAKLAVRDYGFMGSKPKNIVQ